MRKKMIRKKIPPKRKFSLGPLSSDALLNEKIQNKAYELYEKRGCVHGSDWMDWFEAERIIKGSRRKV